MRMPRIRRRVYFSGRVQGVGFRYTCRAIARGFQVGGYVRNLPDGRVEVMAEGEPGELDEFLSAIQSEMNSYIKDATVESAPIGDYPLTDFSVRF
jgi:acylphosphatase